MSDTIDFAGLAVGSVVRLGRWPQGENGETRPIEWQVVEIRGDRALLLSRYVLEMRPWHTEGPERWRNSELRRWLNGEFLQQAFDDAERSRVLEPEAKDDVGGDAIWRAVGADDATEDLDDRVFLLDYADIERCFAGGDDSVRHDGISGEPSPWAAKRWGDQLDSGKMMWWLRSSMTQAPFANIVSPVDTVGMSMIASDNLQGVRPSLWLTAQPRKKGLLNRLFGGFGRRETRLESRKAGPSQDQARTADAARFLYENREKLENAAKAAKEKEEALEFNEGTPQAVKDEVRRLYALADSGDALSQGMLGIRYFNGDGLKQDYARAFRWTKRAAEAGVAPAQADLADHYLCGLGVEADEAEAVRWLKRAADQGFANAQANLGVWYLQGSHVARDVAEGERLLRLAAAQNAHNREFAWDSLAAALTAHPDEASKREGLQWATKAAEAGYASAMARLCRIYMWGFSGMEAFKDAALALKWAREGVKRGIPLCMAVLASLYMDGSGVERDDDEAFRLAEQAGEKGETLGLYLCGFISENRRHDFRAALDYYQRAVALGDSASEPDVARVKAIVEILDSADAGTPGDGGSEDDTDPDDIS